MGWAKPVKPRRVSSLHKREEVDSLHCHCKCGGDKVSGGGDIIGTVQETDVVQQKNAGLLVWHPYLYISGGGGIPGYQATVAVGGEREGQEASFHCFT